MDIQTIANSSFEILDFSNDDIINIGDDLKTSTGHNSTLNSEEWYYIKPKYPEYNTPVLWIKKGLLVKIEPLKIEDYNHMIRVIDIIKLDDFLPELLTRNTFTKPSTHLESIGINQKLINMIPNGQSFFGKIEICSCGHSECYHRNILIIRDGNSFKIPFCHSYASPHEWIEFDIPSLKATYDPDTVYDSDDEDDIENRKVIMNEYGDVIHWEESENKQDYPLVAFNKDFSIEPTDLYDFEFSDFMKF